MENLVHELWIVQAANALFGPLVRALLAPLGFTWEPGAEVIPDYIVMSVVIALLLVGAGLLLRSRLRVEQPGRIQVLVEEVVKGFNALLVDNIGPKGTRYLPLVGTLGLFIFTANMIGKVPGFMSPTASYNVTLGCTLIVWVYYHFEGVRAQGLGPYLKHFAAPPGVPLWIAPIMLPIEIISHLSRVLSLSLRLFGNVFGEELVVLIIASIVPFLVPLPMMVLGVITGTLQAFIFVLLTMIYLAGAVHLEHEHEDEAAAHSPAHATT